MKLGILTILALFLTISSLTAVFSAPANEISDVGDGGLTSLTDLDERSEDMADLMRLRCSPEREWRAQCNGDVTMNTTLCYQLCDCNRLPNWPCLNYRTCDFLTVTRECRFNAGCVCCDTGLKRDTNSSNEFGPAVVMSGCKSLVP